MDRLRQQLAARGAKTIRGLGRTFRQLDSYDGNRKVDAQEFFVGMKETGLDITKQEAECLLQYFDTDGDGCMNFDEFLVGVRGRLNAKRQALARFPPLWPLQDYSELAAALSAVLGAYDLRYSANRQCVQLAVANLPATARQAFLPQAYHHHLQPGRLSS